MNTHSDQLARLRVALNDTQQTINATVLPLLQHLWPGEDEDIDGLVDRLAQAESAIRKYLNDYRFVIHHRSEIETFNSFDRTGKPVKVSVPTEAK